MINWREKIVAFVIHFLVTAVLAGAAAMLVFWIWFPAPFAAMVGGTKLFLLIVSCDLALGPLISLVIYNSKKSRRELLIDYSIVGAVQLAAMIYGLFVIAGSRPAYVAFVVDRFEVIAAHDIDPKELAAAKLEQYRSLPLSGPRFVSTFVPAAEQQESIKMMMGGGPDISFRPRFYVPYADGLEQLRVRAKPLAELEKHHPEAAATISAARAQAGSVPEKRLRWLPVQHRRGFWTVLLDTETGNPVAYLDLDPY